MDNLTIILTSLVAGIITYYINHYLNKGPVFSSALVALASGLILPRIFENGSQLAVIAACASYVGMSSKIRMTTFVEMGIASILCGFIFLISLNVLEGYGGRLGTIAAISVITVWGTKQLVINLSDYLTKLEKIQSERQLN